MSFSTDRPTERDGLITVEHLIVGAGFAGLCAAIKLNEAGERDFVVVEKDSDTFRRQLSSFDVEQYDVAPVTQREAVNA